MFLYCNFSSISSAASILNPGAEIYGAGNSNCSVWTEKRAQKDYFQVGQWMIGSISGAAAFGPELRGEAAKNLLPGLTTIVSEIQTTNFPWRLPFLSLICS